MFSFLAKDKRVLGLDITEDYIRYVVVYKKGNKKEILSYGEERLARVNPKNGLFFALSNIKRKTKTKNAIVSLPEDIARFETVSILKTKSNLISDHLKFRLFEDNKISNNEEIMYFEKTQSVGSEEFYKVLISTPSNANFFKSVFANSGINVLNFLSHKEALISSCIKEGEILPTMIVNLEQKFTNIAVFYPFNQFNEITLKISKENSSQAIKEVYINFYKINNEKIVKFLVSGFYASDVNLLNQISHETRLPIDEADVFANFNLKDGVIPPIPKDESFLYVIAIGLAIR